MDAKELYDVPDLPWLQNQPERRHRPRPGCCARRSRLFAIRRSTGGVAFHDDDMGAAVSSRSVPTTRGPLRWVMPTVPKPGAMRALGSSSASTSCSRVRRRRSSTGSGRRWPRAVERVASRALGRGIRRHDLRAAPGIAAGASASRNAASQRIGLLGLVERLEPRVKRRRRIGLHGVGRSTCSSGASRARLSSSR